MAKIGPGPPSPISGPPVCPIWAQTVLLVKISEKFTFYDWNPHNFGRPARLGEWQKSIRALLHPFPGPQYAQFGPKRLTSVWSRNFTILFMVSLLFWEPRTIEVMGWVCLGPPLPIPGPKYANFGPKCLTSLWSRNSLISFMLSINFGRQAKFFSWVDLGPNVFRSK